MRIAVPGSGRWVAAWVATVAGACAEAPPAEVDLPPRPQVVRVVEHDFSYTVSRREISAGRVVFAFDNRSRLDHDLSIVALPADVPPITEQLRSGNRRAVATVARLPGRGPGSSDALALDLAPGRYALLCFEKDGTGEVHAVLGMAVELRAVSASKGKG